jgi:hypothetical protein
MIFDLNIYLEHFYLVTLTVTFLTKTGWIYMIQYNPYPL